MLVYGPHTGPVENARQNISLPRQSRDNTSGRQYRQLKYAATCRRQRLSPNFHSAVK